jgi:arsenate reductase
MSVTIYGIPNCDTTKKAISLLNKNKIAFTFHDYKQQGISKEKLAQWCSLKNWELIFNKRSTTWRALEEAEQSKIIDQASAIKLMMKQNSIIKRPVIEFNGILVIGFNENELKGLFKN